MDSYVIDMQLSARNLPAGTNGYVDIYVNRFKGLQELFARTQIIPNHRNPDWPSTYRLLTKAGERVILTMEVRDDCESRPTALVGTAIVELATFITEPNQVLLLDPNPEGNAVLAIRATINP